MTDYTPTTQDVRGKYATHQGARYRGQKYLDRRRTEFDRWLEQTLQEARAEAWDEGKRSGMRQADWEHGDTPTMHVAVNPYRKEQAEMNSDLAEAWDKGAETAWNRSTPEVNGTRYHWRHEGEPKNPYRQEKDA